MNFNIFVAAISLMGMGLSVEFTAHLAAAAHLLAERLARLGLGDHVAEDAEHREPAVGHLGVQLLRLLLGAELLAEEAHVVVAVVLRRGPPGHLDEAAEEEDLRDAGGGDVEDALAAVGDVRELELLRERQVARELDVGVVEHAARDRDHGDAAVLALDGAAALEALGLRRREAAGAWKAAAEPARRARTTFCIFAV